MKYDLVFEGGGAKGVAFIGAYEEFVRRGHTFGRLLGTSAGAITATLLAAGYTPEELLNTLIERVNGRPVLTTFLGPPAPFTTEEVRNSTVRNLLRDIDLKFVPRFFEDSLDDTIARVLAENIRFRSIFAFLDRGGWFAADRFVAWLRARLDSGSWKGGQRKFSDVTLAQFFAATQTDLSVVASNTTEGSLLVLNHRTAPDCPLVWAVRMSMSIPFIWEEVIWAESWGPYRGRAIAGHAIVDGGLLSNFPIELFISDEPQVTALMGPKQGTAVIGLLIDESLPVEVPARRGYLIDVHVKPGELRPVQRIMRVVDTATTARDKMVIDEFSHLVVRLPAQGYGTTEFEMSDERRVALVEAGRAAMRTYLERAAAVSAPRRRGAEVAPAAQTGRIADRIATRILEQ